MPEYYIERENSSLSEYGIEFFLQTHSKRGYATRAHIHPAIELIYIMGGEYSVSIDNEEMRVKKGDLLFFRANTIHSIQLIGDEAGSYYVLKITPSLLLKGIVCCCRIISTVPTIKRIKNGNCHISFFLSNIFIK